jgi:hypothetical protein
MPVYVVSYDLNRPGQNYPELWKALNDLNAQRLLLSQWGVRTTSTAQVLRDYLWAFMDQTDRLLVMDRDSGSWAAYNLISRLDHM